MTKVFVKQLLALPGSAKNIIVALSIGYDNIKSLQMGIGMWIKKSILKFPTLTQ